MLFRIIRSLLSYCVLLIALTLSPGKALADPQLFSESWETYTNKVTPYGNWVLDKGDWGNISDQGRNGGKCFMVQADVCARIRHKVNLAPYADIVLQGWLYESGIPKKEQNRCILGLLDQAHTQKPGYPLIRMGVGASGHYNTYTIVYYDHLQASKSIVVDTQMPCEKGWHFMRLDIMHDRTVTYRVWNADQTVENKGNFVWVFDKSKFNYIIVGSGNPTASEVGWDDIKAGSLVEVGPPPRLSQKFNELLRQG